MLIVREAFFGVSSFSGFQKNLGIAKNILTDRLDKLVADEVFEKDICADDSRRYEYALTDKGRALFPVLVALMQWGDKWSGGEPPVNLRDKKTGKKIQKLKVMSKDGAPLKMDDVTVSPGSGADMSIHTRLKPK